MSKKKRMKNKMTKADRRKMMRRRRRKRIAVLIAEVLVLSVLCVIAYGIFKINKMDFNIINQEKLEVYKDTGPYTNIALFGLDSRYGELEGGVQSDCIMIASINNETNDVKLISVYRDTLLQQKDGTYNKANSAYNMGGPEEAISLLNRNFDLDIRNYVSVNFEALVRVIDALGGIDIEMTEEEAHWCNLYGAETARVIGDGWSDIEEKAGIQHLDGIHGVAYARIRYTEGMDFKRAERQRIVLEKVAEKAKEANLVTLNKIIDEVFPLISTSFSMKELLGFASNVLDYNIVDTTGFPYKVTTCENVLNHEGSFVVPIGFENNVIQLHQEVFEEEAYEPSDKVRQIEEDIIYLTNITEETEAIQTTFVGEGHNEGTQ